MSNFNNTSELRSNLTPEMFQRAFSAFLIHAKENAETKAFKGGATPDGLDSKSRAFDGHTLTTHYGRGRASRAPYFNWWVLSIYYVVETGKIVMGIEKHRFPHLHEMKYEGLKEIPGKDEVAWFYQTIEERLDYAELYEKFVSVAEEIMRLSADEMQA